jgi:hypothetical protein
MSKFEYDSFYGGYDGFAVNSQKYTSEQAIEIFKKENEDVSVYEISQAFVRHRAGINEDGEPCVGWWLEYERHDRSCPVWAFRWKGCY